MGVINLFCLKHYKCITLYMQALLQIRKNKMFYLILENCLCSYFWTCFRNIIVLFVLCFDLFYYFNTVMIFLWLLEKPLMFLIYISVLIVRSINEIASSTRGQTAEARITTILQPVEQKPHSQKDRQDEKAEGYVPDEGPR